MKILIVYPHGIGDCILATPAIREYKQQTGNFVGFAMLERFKSSELFESNPYIDELIFTKDMWNDFPNVHVGKQKVHEYCLEVGKEKGYDKVLDIHHSPTGSKILETAEALEIELNNVHTEVYIRDSDKERAKKASPKEDYGFVHSFSPSVVHPNKNLPNGFGERWLEKNLRLKKHVVVGKSFHPTQFNINIQFEIMRQAKGICLIDSAFYHAACALNKKIDFCYFGNRQLVYKRVKHLHKVDENIVFELDKL